MKMGTKLFFLCGILYFSFMIFAYFGFPRISKIIFYALATSIFVYSMYNMFFISKKNKEAYEKWRKSKKTKND